MRLPCMFISRKLTDLRFKQLLPKAPDEERVENQVSAPKPRRLVHQSEEPFEAIVLEKLRRLRQGARTGTLARREVIAAEARRRGWKLIGSSTTSWTARACPGAMAGLGPAHHAYGVGKVTFLILIAVPATLEP